jgi:uncharacterized protein YndB with AHSA1/START domain
MRFMATIDIAAPAQLVNEVYTHVERWPEWAAASVTRVERLDQGRLRVASRARIKQPRLPTTVWEVTEVVTGRSFTWVARGPGIITTASHVVTPLDADGPTRVTASLQQTGPLGQVLGFLTKRLTNRYMQTEVQGLKARCEGRNPGAGPT